MSTSHLSFSSLSGQEKEYDHHREKTPSSLKPALCTLNYPTCSTRFCFEKFALNLQTSHESSLDFTDFIINSLGFKDIHKQE